MIGFKVTYEIVTPESAEHGEAEEIGFVMPGEWKTDIETALNYSGESYEMDLHEALNLCSPDQDSGRWFSETSESRFDYATGAIERRDLYPPRNITPSSYNRLKRLIGAR